jgi:hypothetical protein
MNGFPLGEGPLTERGRKEMHRNAVEMLLLFCDGDYDAAHAAVDEHRKAEAKKARAAAKGVTKVNVKIIPRKSEKLVFNVKGKGTKSEPYEVTSSQPYGNDRDMAQLAELFGSKRKADEAAS